MNKPPNASASPVILVLVILVLVAVGVCAIRFPRPIYVFLVNGNVAAPLMSPETRRGSTYYDWVVRFWGMAVLGFAGLILYRLLGGT